jgi:hypothetical protein
MINYTKKEILISLHIPKCGGSSFDKVLKTWFGFGFHRHYMNHSKMILPKKASFNLTFKEYIPACIHGHFDKATDTVGVFDYYPEARQFITLYRDPLEIQLSFYAYAKKLISEGAMHWKGKKVTDHSHLGHDIDEHLETNSEYKWLTRFIPWKIDENNYKEIIEKNFIHIGITEDLQKSVDIFAEKLNKRTIKVPFENRSGRLDKPSESSIRKFKEKHHLEYLFYNYAHQLNKL